MTRFPGLEIGDFMGPSSRTYSFASDPQGPEDLEDIGAADELRCQHGCFPQVLLLGAAVWWQSPGAAQVPQQPHQRLGALLAQRHGLLLPSGLCPPPQPASVAPCACIKARLVLQRGGEERQ